MFTSYLKVEKTGSQLLEPDKHCCSYLEREKSGSLLFGDQKMYFTTQSIWSLTNTVAAIWREKKVDPCYLETKKCSTQLLE